MVSRSGRYVITYNGEIYNFSALRRDLEREGIGFTSNTDTEVLLEGIAHWGLDEILGKCIGMFAFGLWDTIERTLYLVRDRLGIKPLYYGKSNGAFVFASELKALRAYPEFVATIEERVLPLFLRWAAVPGPYSIYKQVMKLPPGHYLTLRDGMSPSLHPFWNAADIVSEALTDRMDLNESYAVTETERRLIDAVGLRMYADVPLGAFLSGGIDSSTVVALMQSQSSRPVKTYTIGFLERAYDEAGYARKIAEHLKTDHTELYATPKEAMEIIPKLPDIYDEPFADYSQLPTFLISELTKRHVTVALSGDGGDELFGGYPRYTTTPRIWNTINRLPKPARLATRQLIRRIPRKTWDVIGKSIKPIVTKRWAELLNGDRLYKFSDMLTAVDFLMLYGMRMAWWKNPQIVCAEGMTTFSSAGIESPDYLDDYEKMMFIDMRTYLPDDLLVKVDRASMAVGLEVRVPLLDHRLVEFSWRIPSSMKFRQGRGKWILTKVLERHVPAQLIKRHKMGFTVPLDEWLRGPLREWAGNLLNESTLEHDGFFNAGVIRGLWTQHLSRQSDCGQELWPVLMFQAWADRWYH